MIGKVECGSGFTWRITASDWFYSRMWQAEEGWLPQLTLLLSGPLPFHHQPLRLHHARPKGRQEGERYHPLLVLPAVYWGSVHMLNSAETNQSCSFYDVCWYDMSLSFCCYFFSSVSIAQSSLLGCLTQSCLTVCCHFNPWNKKVPAPAGPRLYFSAPTLLNHYYHPY